MNNNIVDLGSSGSPDVAWAAIIFNIWRVRVRKTVHQGNGHLYAFALVSRAILLSWGEEKWKVQVFISWWRLYIISTLNLPAMNRGLDANAGFIDANGKADNFKGQR